MEESVKFVIFSPLQEKFVVVDVDNSGIHPCAWTPSESMETTIADKRRLVIVNRFGTAGSGQGPGSLNNDYQPGF